MILVSPNVSIYFSMYTWGLKHIPLDEIERECAAVGKDIRPKDYENYWNGWYRSTLYRGPASDDMFVLASRADRAIAASRSFLDMDYLSYPEHPFDGLPEIGERWVPCSAENKPLIPWGQGCMTLSDAVATRRQKYLAENLKGTHLIVIDCDGNHGETFDLETVYFLNRWRGDTHCLVKPDCEYDGMPLSFHLTFRVDRLIPTLHFPYAHIDIVGNRRNSLRYWKNKQWNGVEPTPMTHGRWAELQEYIKYRKEVADGNLR